MTTSNPTTTIDTLGAWDSACDSSELHEKNISGFSPDEVIDGVTFTDCVFSHLNFECDEICDSHFIDCVFLECNFSSLKLSDCQFKRCRFYDPDREVGSVFRFTQLIACRFDNCDLTMANFSRANLYRSEWQSCQAQGCDLSHITIESSIGGKVSLYDFAIEDSNLAYSDLNGANLQQANITKSRLIHSDLTGTNLEDGVLTDNELHGITAQNLTLRGCDLRGSSVDGLDIRDIDMSGVTIDEAQQSVLLATLGIIVI